MKVDIETDSVWRFQRTQPEIVNLTRIQNFPGAGPLTHDVAGSRALFCFGQVSAGVFEVFSGKKTISLSDCSYAIWLPPSSILCSRTRQISQSIEISIHLKPRQIYHNQPCLFLEPDRRALNNPAYLFESDIPFEILENHGPMSGFAEKVKSEIDRTYSEFSTLNDIAKRLRTSTTVLGRYFKKSYGLSPSSYRSKLRVVHASLSLLEGKEITDVSEEVGFGDLGRFYKTFKSITTATPGQYHEE